MLQFDSVPEEAVKINNIRTYSYRYSSRSYPYVCDLDYLFCYFKCVQVGHIEVFTLFVLLNAKMEFRF